MKTRPKTIQKKLTNKTRIIGAMVITEPVGDKMGKTSSFWADLSRCGSFYKNDIEVGRFKDIENLEFERHLVTEDSDEHGIRYFYDGGFTSYLPDGSRIMIFVDLEKTFVPTPETPDPSKRYRMRRIDIEEEENAYWD